MLAKGGFPEGMVEEIERFFLTEEDRPRGWDVYPQVFETAMMFPLQRQRELAEMMRRARGVGRTGCESCKGSMTFAPCEVCGSSGFVGGPVTVMEIGCDKGGGLYHWCKSLPTVENVIACEVRGIPYRHCFQDAFPDIEFLWLDGVSSYAPESVNEVDHFTCYDGDLIDCLFIDGDKLGMLKDFEAYLPMMRPGGIVFIHDVSDDDPYKAFSEIMRRGFKCELIQDKTEGLEMKKRVDEGYKPKNSYEAWLAHWYGRSCSVGVVQL